MWLEESLSGMAHINSVEPCRASEPHGYVITADTFRKTVWVGKTPLTPISHHGHTPERQRPRTRDGRFIMAFEIEGVSCSDKR